MISRCNTGTQSGLRPFHVIRRTNKRTFALFYCGLFISTLLKMERWLIKHDEQVWFGGDRLGIAKKRRLLRCDFCNGIEFRLSFQLGNSNKTLLVSSTLPHTLPRVISWPWLDPWCHDNQSHDESDYLAWLVQGWWMHLPVEIKNKASNIRNTTYIHILETAGRFSNLVSVWCSVYFGLICQATTSLINLLISLQIALLVIRRTLL